MAIADIKHTSPNITNAQSVNVIVHTHTGCYRGFAPPAAEFSTYCDQKSNAESDQFSELAQKRRIVKQLW